MAGTERDLEKLQEEFFTLRRETDSAQARLRKAEQQIEFIRAKYQETVAETNQRNLPISSILTIANLRVIIDDSRAIIAANQPKIDKLGSDLATRLYDEARAKRPSRGQG